MGLLSRCLTQFDFAASRRGKTLFDAQAVSNLTIQGQSFLAEVFDNAPHDVEICWSDARKHNELLFDCQCEKVESDRACEHIYATMLEIERQNRGFSVPGHGPLEMFWIGGDDEDIDDFAEGFLDPEVMLPFSNKTVPLSVLKALQEVVGGSAKKGGGHKKAKAAKPPKPKVPDWGKQLDRVEALLADRTRPAAYRTNKKSRERRIMYLLHVGESLKKGKLAVSFYCQETKKNGEFGVVKELKIDQEVIAAVEDEQDRELLSLLFDRNADYGSSYSYGYYNSYYEPKRAGGYVRPEMNNYLLPKLCATGRFGWVKDDDPKASQLQPLAWDGEQPWRLELSVAADAADKNWLIGGQLHRGEEVCQIATPRALFKSGIVVLEDRIGTLQIDDAFGWIQQFRQNGPIAVPKKQGDNLLDRLWSMPAIPPVELPPDLKFEQVRVAPLPRATFHLPKYGSAERLTGLLAFDYGGRIVEFRGLQAGAVDQEQRKVYLRDKTAEKAALKRIVAAGAEHLTTGFLAEEGDVQITRKKLASLVMELTREGWHIEAEGHKVRHAGDFNMTVTSGVDWFELDTTFDFEGIGANLPELLAALRRGDGFVELSDGSRGMLPDDWLKKYAPLAEMGEAEDGKLRFKPTQAALLDALLAAQPDADIDAGFAAWRKKLRSFDGIKVGEQPKTFVGQLRDYQREGLGWLEFLRDFRFGGCLADDMGLGKTIQVLAMLERRRTRSLSKGEERKPSLVVVPKSLITNWVQEAGRFAPQMKVLDYTGTERAGERDRLDDYDLIVTTYGTLRLDVAHLQDRVFDYAILDEAQAIKNSDSLASKASRLIKADHRLAMTGTPIENHLGELWSLFEFLNPGMLGRSSALKLFTASGKEKQDGALELLAQSLRPYLLRRTKEQVLKELPEKTEQTLYCDLEPPQRKLYNELRDHYRALLTKTIEVKGLKQSKIHVLEALLRLRQAACHPGLLDKKKVNDPSAKLDTLMEQLEEVRAEGHKVLVFSQFTSLLSIVRKRLDKEAIVYEYLDGKTTKRQAKVDRFQTDPDCGLFLISLKAGGLGLNLTAADYVYILDPWWNPAVEAQAVDRAHRIGQTKPVFAYRLIARGTVEEKILELQGSKR
ncbi:MAG: SNF2-related protein, partial [Pirellulales bacterium]